METHKRTIHTITLREIIEKFGIDTKITTIRGHVEKANSWDDKDDRLILEMMW